MKRKKGAYRRIGTAVMVLGLFLSGCTATENKEMPESKVETLTPISPSETIEPLEVPPEETAEETEHGSTTITEPPPVPDVGKTALAFLADYAVPVPETVPSHGVVDGYRLSLPYTPKYSMSDVYYFQMNLPRLVRDSPVAVEWNKTIAEIYYNKYSEYLTLLANGPKECYYSLELTWEAYESGDITVIAIRENGGYLGSGAWGTTVSVVYFDQETGTSLTPAEFLNRHTDGTWSPEKVLDAMNADAVAMDDSYEPFILPMENIYGYIPAENGAFYILYLGYVVEGRPLSAAICQEGKIEDIVGGRESYRYPWLDVFKPLESYWRIFTHPVKGTDVFLLGYDHTEPVVYVADDGTFTKLAFAQHETEVSGVQFNCTTQVLAEDTGVDGEAYIIVELYTLFDEETALAEGKPLVYEYVRYRYSHKDGTVSYVGPLAAEEVVGQTWAHTPNRNTETK